ncbi:MAG: rhomboid family intramembrane serine protease [Lachnospiraceae bacterium]|jgi:rhomboid protease GluP|nr:rhomboid family intramembrane serine protease [Lachnospiraceae bacterium]
MSRLEFIRNKRYLHGVLALAVANVVYFLLLVTAGAVENTSLMIQWGALYIREGELSGGLYRLVTSMFMHFDIYHLGSNLLMLMAAGDILEEQLGSLKMLSVYFAGGLAGNIATVLWCRLLEKSVVSAGASGAVFALIGVLCCMVLKQQRQIPGIRRERIFLMVFLMLYSGVANAGINMAAHIGGFLSGMLLGCFFT